MKIPSHILRCLAVTVPMVSGCGEGPGEPEPARTDQNIHAEADRAGTRDRDEARDREDASPATVIAPARAAPSSESGEEAADPPPDAAHAPPQGAPWLEPAGPVGPAPGSAMPEPCPACGLG
ncbi:MAG: hypothetical protein KF795_03345 [Labilithrix sp.]|nr:hypothetical protein [Labilithrix sp.]